MKNIIIVSYLDEVTDEVASFFNADKYKFILSKELESGKVVNFILINSLQQIHEISQKLEIQNQNAKYILLARNNKIQDFCYLNGAMILDPYWFRSELGKILIKRAIEKRPNIQLADVMENYFSKYYSYKIQNILRLGYYADIFCKDAMDQKMNLVSIRTFFDHAVLYLAYLQQFEIVSFPCELEYAFNQGHFVMMIHLRTSDMSQEYLIEAFGDDNNRSPMSSLLKTCYKSCDYFDVMYYPQGKRLTLLGVWLDEIERNELLGSSLSICFIDQIVSREASTFNYHYDFNHQVDPRVLGDLDESKSLPKLAGNFQTLEEMSQNSNFKDDLELLRVLTFFVKEKIVLKNIEDEQKGEDIKVCDITASDVERMLREYPDQTKVCHLDANDCDLIGRLIASGNLANILINLLPSQGNLPLTIESVVESLYNKFINGESIFISEEQTQIRDYRSNWENDFQIIRGALELNSSMERLDLINNISQFFSNEILNVKNIEETIKKPEILFNNNFIKDSVEIKISMKLKLSLSNLWKMRIDAAIMESDVTQISETMMQSIMINKLEKAIEYVLIGNDPELSSVTGLPYNGSAELYLVAMHLILKDLAPNFANEDMPVEEKVILFLNILRNSVNTLSLDSKNQKEENETIIEIIKHMAIPTLHQEVLIQQFPKHKTMSNAKNFEENNSLTRISESQLKETEAVTVVSGEAEFKGSDYTARAPGAKVKEVEAVTVVSGDAEFKGSDYTARAPGAKVKVTEAVTVVSGDAEFRGSDYAARAHSAKVKETEAVTVVSGEAEFRGSDYAARAHSAKVKETEAVTVVSGEAEFRGSDYAARAHSAKVKETEAMTVVSGEVKLSSNDYKVRLSRAKNSNEIRNYKAQETKISPDEGTKNSNHEFQLRSMENKLASLQSEHAKEIKRLSIEKSITKKLLDELKKKVAADVYNKSSGEYAQSSKGMEADVQLKRTEFMLKAKQTELHKSMKNVQSKDRLLQTFGDANQKLEEEIVRLKNKIHTQETAQIDTNNLQQYLGEIDSLKINLNREQEQSEAAKQSYMQGLSKIRNLEMQLKELNVKNESQNILVDKLTAQIAREEEIKRQEAADLARAKAGGALVGTWSDAPRDVAAMAKINKMLEENNKNMIKELENARAKVAASKIEIDSINKKVNDIQRQATEKDKIVSRLQSEIAKIKGS